MFKTTTTTNNTYIQTASTHFGPKVCPANPEVSLVFVADEFHHKFTGLLLKTKQKIQTFFKNS